MAHGTSPFYRVKIRTSAGIFEALFSEHGLYALQLPGQKRFRQYNASRKTGSVARTAMRRVTSQLQSYFKGLPVHFQGLAIDWRDLSTFERQTLQALSRVPYGLRISYSGLATRAGCAKAVRAVGSVMRKNRIPIILPCHRVVRKNGELGQYTGGSHWKARLLQLESQAGQG